MPQTPELLYFFGVLKPLRNVALLLQCLGHSEHICIVNLSHEKILPHGRASQHSPAPSRNPVCCLNLAEQLLWTVCYGYLAHLWLSPPQCRTSLQRLQPKTHFFTPQHYCLTSRDSGFDANLCQKLAPGFMCLCSVLV